MLLTPLVLTCVGHLLYLETAQGWYPLYALPADQDVPQAIVLVLTPSEEGRQVRCGWQNPQLFPGPDRLGEPRRR